MRIGRTVAVFTAEPLISPVPDAAPGGTDDAPVAPDAAVAPDAPVAPAPPRPGVPAVPRPTPAPAAAPRR